LSEKDEVEFTIRILEDTGDFTITEGSSIACTGKVFIPNDPILEMQDHIDSPEIDDNNQEILTSKEIYKELRIRGYNYGPNFRGLVEARSDGRRGNI
jgi:fatty acid synthase, animal type